MALFRHLPSNAAIIAANPINANLYDPLHRFFAFLH